MSGLSRLGWIAPLCCCALLGGCSLWEDDGVEREPDDFDAATFGGAFVFGSQVRTVPALASGGRMELRVEPAYGAPYQSFLATTRGIVTATREGERVTLRSQGQGDDVLTISDPDSDRIYGSAALFAAPIAAVRLLPPIEEDETERRLNPSPPRPLAVLAGQGARFMLALTSTQGRRLLDHAITVRAPDGISLRRSEQFWDILDLGGVPAATPPFALEVTAGGAPWTLELTVATSVERLEAAPLPVPLGADQGGVVCFEGIWQEMAVQGLSWAFEAQNLTLFTTSATPGCVKLSSGGSGPASVTATAGGLSSTLIVRP